MFYKTKNVSLDNKFKEIGRNNVLLVSSTFNDISEESASEYKLFKEQIASKILRYREGRTKNETKYSSLCLVVTVGDDC